MRKIAADTIKNAVVDLCADANLKLRRDVLKAIKGSFAGETNRRAKNILQAIIKNAQVAEKERLAICQDTGMPVVFVHLGQGVSISGDLKAAINKGVAAGYKKYCLRNSIVADPLFRGKAGFSPCVIHTEIVKGNKIKLELLPKGFGCENKTQMKMFPPTADIEEIKKFVIDAVKSAGPDACPPYIVGVGIGGTADYANLLAKKALLRKISGKGSGLEQEMLKRINKTGIGPMGLGGANTALAVHIEKYPTHIAGMPVAVNISCHALRSASIVL